MSLPTQPASQRLFLARAAWIAVAAIGLGLFVAALPGHVQSLVTEAAASSGSLYDFYRLLDGEREILAAWGVTPGAFAAYQVTFEVAWVVLFLTPAVILIWRRPGERMALFVAFMLIVYGVFATPVMGPLVRASRFLALLIGWLGGLGIGFIIIFAYVFPDGRFVPRWSRVPAVIAALLLAPVNAVLVENAGVAQSRMALLALVLPLIALLAVPAVPAQIYRYRHLSSASERQQAKWVLFGLLAAMAGITLVAAPLLLMPSLVLPGRAHLIYTLLALPVNVGAVVLVPMSITMSILRYRLWDIDVIVRRTLIYSLLAGLLALAYFVCVIALESAFRRLTGQGQNQLVTVASTLAIAVLFAPLRSRVQAFIDQRFYRQKYDAARTLVAFGATLRDEVELDRLTDHLLGVVDETLQPATVDLWLARRQ